jgi:central glycolytic genes regulator
VTFLKDLLLLQQRIIPEMVELLDKRYSILKNIYYNQPIGRRALSQALNLGERIVRTEVNFLKDQGLVEINSIGMMVTEDGESILESLEYIMHEINGLSKIEESIKKYLGIEHVIVVPGDLEQDTTVLKEMGRLAANYIKSLILNNSIITLTGGSSVAQVVEGFPKISKENLTVVPARGGMGRDVETQSSTLAAKLANRIGASYKLLHLPDNLSYEALETMMNETEIKDTVDIISAADVLIFGIGRADEMAIKRGISTEELDKLAEKGAIAEAFGYYFDSNGNIIYKTPSIGLRYEHVKNIRSVIAIAGGAGKAEAIIATKTQNPSTVLVTDEAAAKRILNIKEKRELK